MTPQDILEGFNAKQVRVGTTGAVRIAPLGTALPDRFSQKYDKDIFTNLGYCGPDGLKIQNDEEVTEFIPWQELTSIREDITKSIRSIEVTFWQWSVDLVLMYLGKPREALKQNDDGDWYIDETVGGTKPEFMIAADVLDREKGMRIIAPRATVSTTQEIIATRGEVMDITLTFTFKPADEVAYPELKRAPARWLFSNSWISEVDTSPTQNTLAISTKDCPDGVVGTEYSRRLTATNGTSPYTWTLSSGSLPAGLELQAGGTIAGTPSEAGTATFTVKVTDSASPSPATATKELSIAVN